MVISVYLHRHTTSNTACSTDPKKQEKCVLITGNDIRTPHVWYLTGRIVKDKVTDHIL